MLEIEIERSIRVVRQRVTITDREAVEFVGDLKSFSVVHGDRPERINRRQRIGIEMDDVRKIPYEDVSVGIRGEKRVDGIFRGIRAKSDQCDGRPLEIVVSVDPHGLGERGPTVDLPSQCCKGSSKICQRSRSTGLDFVNLGVGESSPIEVLTRNDADLSDARQNREVGRMWRIDLQRLCRAREEVDRSELVDDRQRFGGGVAVRINGMLWCRYQRCHGEPVLNGVHGVVVVWSVGLGTADDPHVRCRSGNHLDIGG